jgi:hypothetical protein
MYVKTLEWKEEVNSEGKNKKDKKEGGAKMP